MAVIKRWRTHRLLKRRQKEYDEAGHDPNYVMYRHRNGTPESEEAKQTLAGQLVELLEPTPGATLLDVGCGEGHITQRLLPYFQQVTGTDLSQGMLDRAAPILPGVPLYQTAADALPFPDGAFSRVLCYGVFLLFPDFAYARKVFYEILRVLEPGGIALIGDVPDVRLKHLSFEEQQRLKKPPLKRALHGARDALADFVLGARPHGFYPLDFFEKLARCQGHECRIVEQTPLVQRAAWRRNVVIRKVLHPARLPQPAEALWPEPDLTVATP